MSWVHFGLGSINKNKKKTDSDQCEDSDDGAKNILSWGNTRDFLRVIQGLDGGIERRDSTLPPLRLLGLNFHDRDSRQPGENGAAWGLVEGLES